MNAGWLILQDIKGFTPLSERLAEKGTEGTEELTTFLNGFFTSAEERIGELGGRIIKLAGDAYFAVLPPDIKKKEIELAGKYLTELDILKSLGTESRFIGIKTGFEILEVPLTQGEVDVVPWGEGVERLMKLEDETERGVIVVEEPAEGKPFTGKDKKLPSIPPSHRPAVALFLNFLPGDKKEFLEIAGKISEKLPTVWLTKWIPYTKGIMGLFLFGFPHASGREMDQAVEVAHTLSGILPEGRWCIGISQGLVYSGVAGGKKFREYTFLGDAVNTAARLSCAGRGEILIPEENLNQIKANWNFEKKGEISLKGKKKPVRIYKLSGKKETGIQLILYPLVGRERELRFIEKAIREKKKIVLMGEPGLGKTRLLFEAGEMAKGNGYRVLLSFSSPNRIPFSLLRSLIESLPPGLSASYSGLIGFFEGKNPGMLLEDALRDFSSMLSGILPFALLIDDLQWADAVSLKFLEHLIKGFEIPVIASSRKENTEIPEKLGMEVMEISPFGRDETEKFSCGILGGKPSSSLVDYIMENTGGVPFFIEQVLLDMKERGMVEVKDEKWEIKEKKENLPDSVFSSILSRFDRFDRISKRILEYLSCMGNEVKREKIIHVLPSTWWKKLEALNREGFILKEEEIYFFKHALVRETIYHSLLHRRRKELHHRIASALEKHGYTPYEIAYHYELAGMRRKAEENYLSAYEEFLEKGLVDEAEEIKKKVKAKTLKDYMEAFYLFESGKYAEAEKIAKNVAKKARGRFKIKTHLLLAEIYDLWLRYDEMRKSLEMAEKLDKKGEFRLSLYNHLGIYYDNLGRHREALRYYRRTLELARRKKTPDIDVHYFNLGWIHFKEGRLKLAYRYFTNSLRTAGENRRTQGWCYLRLGQIYHVWKDYEKSERYLEEALRAFTETSFPYGKYLVHGALARIYMLRGMKEKAREHAFKADSLSLEIYGHHEPETFLILLFSGFIKDAVKFINQEKFPENFRGHLLPFLLLEQGKIECLKREKTDNPFHKLAFYYLNHILPEKESEEARELLLAMFERKKRKIKRKVRKFSRKIGFPFTYALYRFTEKLLQLHQQTFASR